MNTKFFTLPSDKQRRILGAAYKVFSQNDYKTAPMLEIAEECGVSKSLLFHYFGNKKGLYLYLWQTAKELTAEAMCEAGVPETADFFEMLTRNLLAKCSLMRKYPYICAFSTKAYYEREPEIQSCIQAGMHESVRDGEKRLFERIDRSIFRPDIEPELLYQEILWTADGYLCQKSRLGKMDADEVEKDFLRLIKHWKKVYIRQDESGVRKY